MCPVKRVNLETTKKRIKNTLLQLMENSNSCNSPSALKQLDKQLSAAKNLFTTLIKVGKQEVIPLTKENIHAPANKNMEIQRRFFTTKKRHKRTKVRLSKPSIEKQEKVLEILSFPW